MGGKSYKHYTETCYNGRKLLEKHDLDEEGTWQIYGEDPNCDMGGYHHTPFLETVEGRLRDVIEYAVCLGSFWGVGFWWGN